MSIEKDAQTLLEQAQTHMPEIRHLLLRVDNGAIRLYFYNAKMGYVPLLIGHSNDAWRRLEATFRQEVSQLGKDLTLWCSTGEWKPKGRSPKEIHTSMENWLWRLSCSENNRITTMVIANGQYGLILENPSNELRSLQALCRNEYHEELQELINEFGDGHCYVEIPARYKRYQHLPCELAKWWAEIHEQLPDASAVLTHIVDGHRRVLVLDALLRLIPNCPVTRLTEILDKHDKTSNYDLYTVEPESKEVA